MTAAGSMKLTVFTKPWKTPLAQLAAHVKKLGLDGVELPVRPGFQVEPGNVSRGLVEAVRIMADHDLTIASIAGPTDEATIAACADAGVPLIRILIEIPHGIDYLAHEARVQREFDALVPLLDRYNVAIGIQNECGRYVANAMGIRHLIERYDRKHFGAILDPAHCALNGEIPELALDIVWSHLHMVNLKNVYWKRIDGPEGSAAPQGFSRFFSGKRPAGPESSVAAYEPYWTGARQGLCSWQTVAAELKRRGYDGPVCFTAEYSDAEAVDRLIAEDAAYARSLLG